MRRCQGGSTGSFPHGICKYHIPTATSVMSTKTITRGADLMGHSHLTHHPPNEPYTQLRPRNLTDRELDPTPMSFTQIPLLSDDDKPYVPGMEAVSDVFMAWWHAKSDRAHRPPEEALERGLAHVQRVLDGLPPELRWRGGLSRSPGASWGHDAQMVQIFVTNLYVKSNLLQRFGALSSILTHRDIIRSVNSVAMARLFRCGQKSLVSHGVPISIHFSDRSRH